MKLTDPYYNPDHIITKLTDALNKAHHDLALERFRRLTLEIESAIAANDGVTWARACAERMRLGLAEHEVEGLWPKREAL